MNFNLTDEEAEVQLLKEELGISPSRPHLVELSLWRHFKADKLQLECKVSIFTNDDRCVQGQGANFGDAFEAIKAALRPKSCDISPTVEVKVITPEPED